MIEKIKASKSEKILFIFLILLGLFSITSFFLLKNKCLFVKNYNPNELEFEEPENIAVLNTDCGNVIIELTAQISPETVRRFKMLIRNKAYDNIAFHRVLENTLVQAGDLEFGKKGNLNYSKIGSGKSGYGLINSELEGTFSFTKGSVGFARTNKINTEDSQFFIILKDIPLFDGEYTPVGRVLYGLEVLEKVKFVNKYQIVPRPDFINTFRMLIN
jgi:cyclophilin family peptidyl-prolyl cis-trans isomerase